MAFPTDFSGDSSNWSWLELVKNPNPGRTGLGTQANEAIEVSVSTILSNCTRTFAPILVPPMVMGGFALPLGFVSQVDGYLKYLRPVELLFVYGWGWCLSLALGIAIGAIASFPVAGAARLFRQSPSVWVANTNAWFSLCIAALAFVVTLQLWLKAYDLPVSFWMGQSKYLIAIFIAIVAGTWVRRHRRLPEGLCSVSRLGMIVGVVVLLGGLSQSLPLLQAESQLMPVTTPVASNVAKGPPNIVLVTIDTLAAGHMSLYGYARKTTPSLDNLAKRATVFENFYAGSNSTTVSMNTIMLGQRPWTHRMIHSSARLNPDQLPDTLLAKLREANYQTFVVTTQASPFFLGAEDALNGFAELPIGEQFFGRLMVMFPYYARLSVELGLLGRILAIPDSLWARLGQQARNSEYDPVPVLAKARYFIERRNLERPFFMWVHLLPPHAPYSTPEPFSGRFDSGQLGRTRFDSTPMPQFTAVLDRNFPQHYVGRYDEAIAYVDHHVGAFAQWLQDKRLYEDAIVIITADHGESFTKSYGTHGGPLLHQALIRVPLIFKEPAQRQGRRTSEAAEHVDLMPTILDLLKLPAHKGLEGRILRPGIQEQGILRPVFAMNLEQSSRYGALGAGSVAMLEGRWKYIHYRGKLNYPLMPKLEDALYDLDSDPLEEINLVATHAEIAERMLREIQRRLSIHGVPVQ